MSAEEERTEIALQFTRMNLFLRQALPDGLKKVESLLALDQASTLAKEAIK